MGRLRPAPQGARPHRGTPRSPRTHGRCQPKRPQNTGARCARAGVRAGLRAGVPLLPLLTGSAKSHMRHSRYAAWSPLRTGTEDGYRIHRKSRVRDRQAELRAERIGRREHSRSMNRASRSLCRRLGLMNGWPSWTSACGTTHRRAEAGRAWHPEWDEPPMPRQWSAGPTRPLAGWGPESRVAAPKDRSRQRHGRRMLRNRA